MLEWDGEDREKQPGHGRNKIALRPQPNLVGQWQMSELEEGSRVMSIETDDSALLPLLVLKKILI